MISCARYDRGTVHGDARVTEEGYIRANAIVTRTGVFSYKNNDGTIRRELRHPDDVWDAESIESLELIPITNNHPYERLLNAENAKRLAIGYTGESVKKNGEFLMTKMVITDKEGVDAVTLNGRKELSLGYTVDVEPESGIYKGQEYDARQRNIRYNHLAIVDKARAGSEARIALDSLDAVEVFNGENEMAKRKIKIDEDEYMVDETTANYIDRLQMDVKNLTDERDRVESELKMIMDKLEKALAERDSERDLNSEVINVSTPLISMDSAEFKNAVSARVSLFKVAQEHLDSDEINILEKLSNIEIMKSVISKARKSINLDGKSDVYIQALYDTILDEKTKTVNLDNVHFTPRNAKNSDESDVVKARQKMMENQQNASRGGK